MRTPRPCGWVRKARERCGRMENLFVLPCRVVAVISPDEGWGGGRERHIISHSIRRIIIRHNGPTLPAGRLQLLCQWRLITFHPNDLVVT